MARGILNQAGAPHGVRHRHPQLGWKIPRASAAAISLHRCRARTNPSAASGREQKENHACSADSGLDRCAHGSTRLGAQAHGRFRPRYSLRHEGAPFSQYRQTAANASILHRRTAAGTDAGLTRWTHQAPPGATQSGPLPASPGMGGRPVKLALEPAARCALPAAGPPSVEIRAHKYGSDRPWGGKPHRRQGSGLQVRLGGPPGIASYLAFKEPRVIADATAVLEGQADCDSCPSRAIHH